MPTFDPTDPTMMQQAPTRALKLKSMPFPGKKIKEAAKEAAGEYITDPLAEAGYPDTGAALGAGVATAADIAVPEDWEEAALSAIPVGKGTKMLGKAGEEFAVMLSKIDKEIQAAKTVGQRDALLAEKKALKSMAEENAPTVDYGQMKKDRQEERAAAEAAAPVLNYKTIPNTLITKEKNRAK
jgi:hypothetical protein